MTEREAKVVEVGARGWEKKRGDGVVAEEEMEWCGVRGACAMDRCFCCWCVRSGVTLLNLRT